MPRPLTSEQVQLICGQIRAGCYPHVAAASAGVPRRDFVRWVRRGRRQRRGWCREFWLQISAAQAQAQAVAEAEVRGKDVKFWLRYGPGKERPGKPGWGSASKPVKRKRDRSAASRADLMRILTQVVKILEPFPEIRRLILAELEQDASAKRR